MKTIFAIAFIASVYASPVIAILAVILALFALSIIASFCNKQVANDAVLDAAYDNLKDAFDDIYSNDDTVHTPTDIWHTTEPTSCELCCPVEFALQPVKLLAPAQDNFVLVDYTIFTYRELQAKCKALRTKKNNIKLTAKKAILIKWLQSQS